MTPPFDFAPESASLDAAGSSFTDAAGSSTPSRITLGTLVERHQAQLPIADTMIDDALNTFRAAEALLD